MRVFTVFEILATYEVPNFNQKKVQRAAPSFYVGWDPLPTVALREMLKKKIEYFGNFVFRGCKGTKQSTPTTIAKPDSSTALQVDLKCFHREKPKLP